MNPNLTEIAYILDRSGSMEILHEAPIATFNEFLKRQLDMPGDARLTLVLFDDEYLVPIASKPLEEVPKLDACTYLPRGCTALLDAIGETIDTLGQRLAATPEPERPGKVVVVVFTDGLENASQRFTWKNIAALVKQQREKYAWEFLFLGANQDAIATAAQMNMAHHHSSGMQFSAAGLHGAAMAASRKVHSLRNQSMGIYHPDIAAPMSQLVEEETKAAEAGLPRRKPPTKKTGQ